MEAKKIIVVPTTALDDLSARWKGIMDGPESISTSTAQNVIEIVEPPVPYES